MKNAPVFVLYAVLIAACLLFFRWYAEDARNMRVTQSARFDHLLDRCLNDDSGSDQK